MKQPLVLLTLFLLPQLALAHGDHGATLVSNIEHVLAHLEHSWPLVLAVVIVIAIAKRPVGQWLKKFSLKD